MKNLLNKIFRSRFYPLILGALYMFLLGIVVYMLDYHPKGAIADILKKWVPWNLKVNFGLILAGLWICRQDLWHMMRQFVNRKGVYLGLLVLLAFVLVVFATVRTHRIFYDEDIYANVGQNIALTNQTGFCNYGTFEYGEYYPHWISYNKEPSGWPFLISLVFQLFGTDEYYAFLLNNLIFSAGVLVVFFITWHITGSFFGALVAGLAFTLTPHNLIWSNTVAAEPAAGFFGGLSVLTLIVFLKSGRGRHLFLLVMLVPLACQMRPESMLIVPWVVATWLIWRPKSFINRSTWTMGLLSLLFLLPHFLHFYAVSGHSWGASGSKFALEFLGRNLYTNGIYYLDNKYFPVLFTALAAAGLFGFGKFLKWRLLILGWFLPFWGIFLFFYAGSYRYGADVRFALVSFMPLAILAGIGGGIIKERIKNAAFHKTVCALIVLVMLLAFIQFLPLVRRMGQEAWGARHDHKYAKMFKAKVPERSIILTQNPTMFLLWNQNTIQTYAGINNPGLIKNLMKKYQGHVYFHYNYWCNTKNDRNQRLCRGIKERYRLTAVATAKEQDYEYGLYKMSMKEK